MGDPALNPWHEWTLDCRMNRRTLSRRDFLRLASGALASFSLPPNLVGSRKQLPWDRPLPPEGFLRQVERPLGRVTTYRLAVRAEPDSSAEIVDYRAYDDLITLRGSAEGPGEMAHNSIWFKTTRGYVYSSFVQPVKSKINCPLLPSQVSEEQPVLFEVTVPYTDTQRGPELADTRVYRLYYSSTHWGVAVERDAGRRSWYKLRNDRGHGHYYARSDHLRPISWRELAPIAPGSGEKRIEINLSEQRLTAYEGDQAVLTTRVATGAVFGSSDGVTRDFRTAIGTFRVLKKRASRHMEGGTPGVDFFNLPGVPWVSYFTAGGAALHGTYWHNDYGRQRSHGCVNLAPEQARWLYLWTEPTVPADEEVLAVPPAAGTPIHIYY